MTPLQKINWLILCCAYRYEDLPQPEYSAETIDDLFDQADCDNISDATNEIRCTGIETGLKSAHWSRHYEHEEVAAQLPDGSWVGWTYWYGGGKHGEPEAIDWMEDAYDVSCVEKEELVIVRTFSK